MFRDAGGHENNKMCAQVRSDVQTKRLVSFHRIEFNVTIYVTLNTWYGLKQKEGISMHSYSQQVTQPQIQS